jgi:hypothetical protein
MSIVELAAGLFSLWFLYFYEGGMYFLGVYGSKW